MPPEKILILYSYYWPFYKAGGPVQSLFNLVAMFVSRADFYLFSLSRDVDGESPEQPVPVRRWTHGPNGEKVCYFRQFNLPTLFRYIHDVDPEVIYVNGIFNLSTTFAGLLYSRYRPKKLIIAPRGMLQGWALDKKKVKKRVYLAVFKMLLPKHAMWHATDDRERNDIIREFGRQSTIFVAPNVVRKLSPFSAKPYAARGTPVKMVFLSLINSNKNLLWVIQAALACKGKVSLDIYGPVMDISYWHRCVEVIGKVDFITYKGTVPAWQVPEVLSQYHFFALPTNGENFGHAIFDALSASVPVIITPHTPWRDLDRLDAGWYISNAAELAEQFEMLTSEMSEVKYQSMRKAAFDYAVNYVHTAGYERLYAPLLNDAAKTII